MRNMKFLILLVLLFGLVTDTISGQNQKSSSKQVEQILRQKISVSKNLAKRIRSTANSINDELHVGTMYNEIDIPEHSCFVLGSLLGQQNFVKHLEVKYQPNYTSRTSKNAHNLRVMAISLDNFSNVAIDILAMPYGERVIEWNLDCVGNYRIPKNRWIGEGKEKTFVRITNQGKVLQILGAIETGFSDKIISAIKNNPDVETISLGSGGGSVYEALKAGRYIRSLGLETTLWNNCYSACPLVFIGGETRTIWSPFPSLGLHQVYTINGAVPFDSEVYVDIYKYLDEMGVDSKFIVTNMWKAAPNKINTIQTDANLCRTKIATWVQRWCSSDDYK